MTVMSHQAQLVLEKLELFKQISIVIDTSKGKLLYILNMYMSIDTIKGKALCGRLFWEGVKFDSFEAKCI